MTTAWIDGRPAPVAALQALALVNYGHFTTMQVRAGAVRGLDLHLARLCAGSRELFGHVHDPAALRDQLRRALAAAGAADCTLRATAFAPGLDPLHGGDVVEPLLLVALSAPRAGPQAPPRVRSFDYQRAAPHLKHVGTFPLLHFRRLARDAGFDDALFATAGGRVLEGTTWNAGFLQDDTIVWPEGPALDGTARALLRAGLDGLGVPQVARPVALAEASAFDAAFACNAGGAWLLAGVDGHGFAPPPRLGALLERALAAQPAQRP